MKAENLHKSEASLVYTAISRGKKKINFHVICPHNMQTEIFWNEQKKHTSGIGETVKRLRTLDALPKGPWFESQQSHGSSTTIRNSTSGGVWCSLLTSVGMRHAHGTKPT